MKDPTGKSDEEFEKTIRLIKENIIRFKAKLRTELKFNMEFFKSNRARISKFLPLVYVNDILRESSEIFLN